MVRQARPCVLTLLAACAAPLLSPHAAAAGEADLLEAWLTAAPATPATVLVDQGHRRAVPLQRCGTPEGTSGQRRAIEEGLDLWRSLGRPAPERQRTIRVAFHVLSAGEEGDVPEAQIAEQIRVLNRGFRRSGQTFELVHVDRTAKRRWFRKCAIGTRRGTLNRVYLKIARRLAVDPSRTLNVYSCGPYLQGQATYPWFLPENNFLHGVVIHWSSLPGSPALPDAEGGVLVHEVGHWTGLYHTFTPWESTENGCQEPGDEVRDTPFEREPAVGCPTGRDTCPQPGLDPIHNFMDYSDDACVDRLTGGQRRRLNDVLDLYRPSLGS
jgi:hypothetical protein